MIITEAEQQYLDLRRKQAAALRVILGQRPGKWSEADTQYNEAGEEASRIARENDFSDETCLRLNKWAGL